MSNMAPPGVAAASHELYAKNRLILDIGIRDQLSQGPSVSDWSCFIEFVRTCIVDEDPGYTPDDHQIETYEMHTASTLLQHAAFVSGREVLLVIVSEC